MAIRYTDKEIANFIAEVKPLPEDWQNRMNIRPKRGHKEKDIDIKGVNGNKFRLKFRQSASNHLDFSIIIALRGLVIANIPFIMSSCK